MWPAKFAYQVWECSRSAPSQSAAISRSVPRVLSAALTPESSDGVEYAKVPGSSRSAPKARTRTSMWGRSTLVSSATCTPAPP